MENNNKTKAGESYSLKDYVVLNAGTGSFFVDRQEQQETNIATGEVIGRSYFVVRFRKEGNPTKKVMVNGVEKEVEDTIDFGIGKNLVKEYGLEPSKMNRFEARNWIASNIGILKATLAMNSKGEQCKMPSIFTGRAEGNAW